MNAWDKAEEGEIWWLSQLQRSGAFETRLWTRMDHGHWKSLDEQWWLIEDEDIELVKFGKRYR